MAWMAAIGGVVASAFGATAISAGMAAVVGGIVVGAAAGAIYTAFKGGNLLKNMAFGALGGAALGGVGAFVAGGTSAFTATAQIGGLGAGQIATGMTSVWGAMSGSGAAGGGGLLSGIGGAGAGGGGAGSNAGVWGLGGLVGNLGAGYLNGLQATKDREADLAMQEKRFELENKGIDAQLAAAEMGATTSRENALTAAETAANQLEFAKDKFGKEFAEDTRRYNQERDDATKLRDDFRSSVVAGSQYASGAMPTIRPLELKRQRMELPQPSWITGKNQQVAQGQPAQPQRGLLAEQQAQGLPKPPGLPA